MIRIDSILSASFLGQLRSIVLMPTSRDKPDLVGVETSGADIQSPTPEPATKMTPSVKAPKPIRKRKALRPEPGSLYHIMHEHAGTALFVLPLCWTDLHSQLLGATFTSLPVIDKPVPALIPGRFLEHEPSELARSITTQLHVLIRPEASQSRLVAKTRAIKHVMSTLFPETLTRAKTAVDLDLFFGPRLFRKAIRIPCMWKLPTAVGNESFDSAVTVPFSSVTTSGRDAKSRSGPILAYFSRSQMAAIRKNIYNRVVPGPNNSPNEPVVRLQQLRSKMLTPADVEHDPYMVATMIAMAQAHFYSFNAKQSSQALQEAATPGGKPVRMRPPTFGDVKVHVITHDEGDACQPHFFVYSAEIKAEFLDRFMHPDKAPKSVDGKVVEVGLDINYSTVPFWPILGLKERLAKALGHEVSGTPLSADPDHIGLWHDLLNLETPRFPMPYDHMTADPIISTPSGRNKRRRNNRPGLSDMLNSSFEDEPASSPDDRPVHSPNAKRRRTARTVHTLEVC